MERGRGGSGLLEAGMAVKLVVSNDYDSSSSFSQVFNAI
jgi:hypothetical protein